ncbi:TPA: hypothetical protein N0F65_002016 [Lagenidium giganteum]|uniref:CG-1 domain-containing protein n=1 Tax=Lagenidium giganteum TaxID=4803 RepID=A0AAV2YY83_9STRA|nr:TPA: hypothetical protein N0F65_002016 [Lagenidium giganteum]
MNTRPDAVEEQAQQLIREATRRWLVKDEIVFLLLHFKLVGLPLHQTVQVRPPSGSLMLYDTAAVADYKRDGWRWQKRKDGSGRVREDRAKLVINREVIILGSYVHSADVATFHRRSYGLRDSEHQVVLVHYFDEAMKTGDPMLRKGAITTTTNRSGKSFKRALPATSPAPNTVPLQALKVTVKQEKPEESMEMMMNGEALFLIPLVCATLSDHSCETSDCFDMDFLQSQIPQPSVSTATPDLMDFEMMQCDGAEDIPSFDDLLFTDPTTQEIPSIVAPSASDNAVAEISDFSPDWDFVHGGAKILICLASSLSSLPVADVASKLMVHFGPDRVVPAEKISDMVLRCTAPAAMTTGMVQLFVCLHQANECRPVSRVQMFTYKSPSLPSPPRSNGSDYSATHSQPPLSFGKRGRSSVDDSRDHDFDRDNGYRESEHLGLPSEPSTLSAFVDTDCECLLCACKIRVVERLSEFQKAILTTSVTGDVPTTDINLLDGDPEGSEANLTENTPTIREKLALDTLPTESSDADIPGIAPSSSPGQLALDDFTIERLSDKELEQLSEKLLERVVRQLVTVAHTNEELLEELNSLDETGLSLLHYVSFYNYAQLVPLLLSHGAHINQQSTQGQTSLHLAAGCGNTSVVDVLVDQGADVAVLDFDGFTAAERAEKSGHHTIASKLRALMNQREDQLIFDGLASWSDDHAMEVDSPPPDPLDFSVRGTDPSKNSSVRDRFLFQPLFHQDCLMVLTCLVLQVDENHEHNRKLLLGAFSTMSLHDKCALSLGISRDSTTGNRRRGSSIGDESSFPSSFGGSSASSSPLRSSEAGFPTGASPENESDVKSVIADDEASLTKYEAAMELMGPEELQSLEDEVKVIQFNVRAWLLRRNCRNMRETTKKLHEATKSIEHEQKKQLEQQAREETERKRMAHHDPDELERAAVTVQAATRSMLARKSFLQTKNVTIKVQAATRGVLCRKNFARMKTHALASLVIQRNVFEWWNNKPSARTSGSDDDPDSHRLPQLDLANTATSDTVVASIDERFIQTS